MTYTLFIHIQNIQSEKTLHTGKTLSFWSGGGKKAFANGWLRYVEVCCEEKKVESRDFTKMFLFTMMKIIGILNKNIMSQKKIKNFFF